MNIVTFGPPGGVIEGVFEATLDPEPGSSPGQMAVPGKFRVCRGPDEVVGG